MRSRLIGSFLVAGLFPAAGCGAGASKRDEAQDIDNFVNSVADAQCAWQFRCCTDSEIPAVSENRYADEETCRQALEADFRTTFFTAWQAVQEKRRSMDETARDACLRDFEALGCNPAGVAYYGPWILPSSCQRVFVGALPAGSTCSPPSTSNAPSGAVRLLARDDCVPGARCVATASADHGVCVPYQEENQVCGEQSPCDPGPDGKKLVCRTSDHLCHPPAQIGEACEYWFNPDGSLDDGIPCPCGTAEERFIYCDPSSRTCKYAPGPGESCLPASTIACGIDYAGAGWTNTILGCDRSIPTKSASNGLLWCDSNSNLCMSPAKSGERCSLQGSGSGVADYCEQGLLCTCPSTGRGSWGDSCTSNTDCLSGYCQSWAMFPLEPDAGITGTCAGSCNIGTCQALGQGAPGEPCMLPTDCQSGSCQSRPGSSLSPDAGVTGTCAASQPQCAGR
jgi:hypothetical protein